MIDKVLLTLTGIILIFDLWLVLTKRPTISHRYQKWAPTYVDLFIMCLLIPGLVHIELADVTKVIFGVLMGHVFWPNKERFA